MRILCILLAVVAVLACDGQLATGQTANSLLNEAIKLHRDGKVEDAMVKYKEVAQTAEASNDAEQAARARFAIAACLFSLKDYDAAVAAFEEYAEHLKQWPFDPNGPLALVYAGNCRMEQGRIAEAEPYYTKALLIKQAPENMIVWDAWAHLGMGRVLVEKKDYQAALPHLAEAIERAQEPRVSKEAADLLLRSFGGLEQPGAAASTGNAVAQANLALGTLYHDQKKHAEAVPYLRRAVAEATDGSLLADSYIMLGESLVYVGSREEGLKAFQAVGEIKDTGSAFQQKRAHFLGVAAVNEAIMLARFGRGSDGVRLCDETLATCRIAGVESWVMNELEHAKNVCQLSLGAK